MAIRSYWKGYLKLSLVYCGVQMVPATSENDRIRFHTLNRSTHNRVVSHYIDSITGKEVKEEDEVKGYHHGEDKYVILEDDELENVNLDSTRTIDIFTFVPRDSIEWIWLDKPYYLTPNEQVSEEAYSVIRDAMEAQKMVGISRLVIARRERAVMLEPRDKGIVLWTLRYGDEVRSTERYYEGVGNQKAEENTITLIGKLIKKQIRDWDTGMVMDPVQNRLVDIIDARKTELREMPKPKTKQKISGSPNNVIDIMDALRKSLAGITK